MIIFHKELNNYAFVGVIMLVGIVKENVITMIDFALDAQRREGKSDANAIYKGCFIRFRPIMMTTMAALMSILPFHAGKMLHPKIIKKLFDLVPLAEN